MLGGDLLSELLGVGYIIGPRIASTMMAGGVLAYLVIVPLIVIFSANQSGPIAPAPSNVLDLVVNEKFSKIREHYTLYIGAGAVAAGGVISMIQALPLIFSSAAAGWRDLRKAKKAGPGASRIAPRTDRDLPLSVVLLGTLGLVVALTLARSLGLGFSVEGIAGALLIVLFGFLFVTVSARLTGEIGSSSNPISGMTVATLLFTCLIFLMLGRTDKPATLAAMTVAAVVCVAASNGGGTAQDLKTGFLVGATPRKQQYAILIGALTSALVIGGTLLLLNRAGTVYTRNPEFVPKYQVPAKELAQLNQMEYPGGQYAKDYALYHVLHAREGELPGVPQGRYLVDDQGWIRYLVDPAINGRVNERDDHVKVTNKFEAPKAQLMKLIVDGILNQKLPWSFVLIGVLIAVTVQLMGMPSLPFAVGVYLPIQSSVPIFIGGVLRWLVLKRKRSAAESEMSPGTLLATGYIAGGTIGGVLVAFTEFLPYKWIEITKLGERYGWVNYNWPAAVVFGVMIIVLLFVALRGGSKSSRI